MRRWQKMGARPGQHARTHNSWVGLRQRCFNPNYASYKDYGGRGIGVCDRWQSFEAFFEDMGPKPEGMTLDRIDNDGDYSPENCRWATPKQQRQNQRARTMLTLDGSKMRSDEAAKLYHMTPNEICVRRRKADSAKTSAARKARKAARKAEFSQHVVRLKEERKLSRLASGLSENYLCGKNKS